MKRKSRFLALLMVLCLLTSLLTLPAAAANADDVGEGSDVVTPEQTPTPDPEPEPDPDPKPDPTPEPDPDPTPDPEPTPDPKPDPNPTPTPDPTDPTDPEDPKNPTDPEDPKNPTAPEDPKNPTDPENPKDPTNPETPPVQPEKPTVTAPTKSNYMLSDTSYNFGTLEKGATGSSLTKTITVTNTSGVPMTISSSVSSGKGFSISGLPTTVAANSSRTFTVSLSSAKSTGSYSEIFTITAAYDGGSFDRTLSVSAAVTETGYAITVSPTSKDFGKLTEGYDEKTAKEKEITVTIKNTGGDYVRMDGVKGDEHFTVTPVKSATERVDAGKEVDYKIVPKQGVKTGTYTDKIVFQTREGATAEFKATLAVEKAVAALELTPASLDFGTAEEGYVQPGFKSVTIKNNTAKSLTLEQPISSFYEFSLLSNISLAAGSSATMTVRPKAGMAANNYSGVINLRAGSETAKLTVSFNVSQKVNVTTFTDVAANSTFAPDIAYVSQRGIMGEVSNGQFKPGNAVTRGQLVTMLYRLEGQPAVSGAGFSDVAAGSYCENAVKWAAANGITNGSADGTFKPNDPITRQQFAAFLYRYNNYKGYAVAKQADLSAFPDGASVASYARDALSWANGVGLVNGTGEGKLNPAGGATRGQAAAILHRFCVNIGR